MKTPIASAGAPAAIGPYSQAIRAGDTVWLSGQIPLDPRTMQLVDGFEAQAERVFDNLEAVCREAGGGFDDVVRVTIYLTDLANFAKVNEAMAARFREPHPARVTVGVASLPRGAQVEIDAVMHSPVPRESPGG
ncbi:MAG: RidA family protein [Betaproteobacteria bacterium]|nr:RidA family protein [Betaproteobacteria bacterium]